MKIINLDKRQYLSPTAFGHGDTLEEIAGTRDGVMQALAILCSDGNGRGGGDLHSADDIIGTWAGDRIAIVSSTYRDGALSEPGLEDVPLLEQIVETGVDISEVIIAAIVAGEGTYSSLYGLPKDSTLRLKFRSLFGDQCQLFVANEEGAQRAARSLREVAALLNAEIEETLPATFHGMGLGANRIAEAFALPVRWRYESCAQADDGKYFVANYVSSENEAMTLRLDFNAKVLTAARIFEAFKLQEVLKIHGAEAPESKLPASILKIINDAMNRGAQNPGQLED